VGHFGFVLFAKASKPIWPAPATARFDFSAEKSKLQKEFYTGSHRTQTTKSQSGRPLKAGAAPSGKTSKAHARAK